MAGSAEVADQSKVACEIYSLSEEVSNWYFLSTLIFL